MPRWNGKIADDIFAYAIPEPNSGCWLWERCTNSSGYGHVKVYGKMRGAHIIAYEKANSCSILSGYHVCHTCDVPACINPNHLFLSDHDGNMADMAKKKRNNAARNRGIANPSCKLTIENVLDIRADNRTCEEIGSVYGVSFQHVADIKRRKKWAHL